MKTSLSIIAGLAATAAVLSSCRDLFGDRQGSISISFTGSSQAITRSAFAMPDTEDFLLTVTDQKGKVIYDGLFKDSPENIEVSAGNYTVTAVSEKFDKPAYDSPQYGDTRVVTVKSGESVAVQLTCRQLNSGISLGIDDSFRSTFPGGTISISGNGGSLKYAYGEDRTAFFNAGAVSVTLSDSGVEQTLFSRILEAQQILHVDISASVGRTSGAISIQVDTSRTWLSENFTFGEEDASCVENAMNVTQARQRGAQDDVWVYGYIVGVATGTGRFSFDPPFSKNTNILLGLRAATSDPEYILSVELKSGAIRDDLNLMDNANVLGRQIYMKGDLVSAYYGVPGLKNVTEYQF